MRRRLGAAACAALLLSAQVSRGQGIREERTEVEEKLASSRATLELLKNKKVSALAVLDLMERVARGSAARARAADEQIKELRKRIEVAERIQAVADGALAAQLARLSPRLTVMYRMMRKNPLEVLLSAQDFAALVWRSRAMTRLVDSDLRLLGEVQRAARFQRQGLRELKALQDSLGGRLVVLKEESGRAERQRRELADLVSLIQAQAAQASRVVHDLEQADRELAGLISDMDVGPASSGFGALHGHLPLPVQGRIEVGFGKVVNPKFNTVTVQKGLDIRAEAGTPVKAIAPGKVVYAGWLKGYGNLLILDHGEGYHSLVAHLAELGRAVGETVQTGDNLGMVGDTGSLKGAYLYFELRKRGEAVDPAPWMGVHRR